MTVKMISTSPLLSLIFIATLCDAKRVPHLRESIPPPFLPWARDFFQNEQVRPKALLGDVNLQALQQQQQNARHIAATALPPVVIIPSLIGNRLWATLNKAPKDHWWCDRDSSQYLLWVGPTIRLPLGKECFLDNFKFGTCDASLGNCTSRQGVQTTADVEFGKTYMCETLDDFGKAVIWKPIVDALVTYVNYTRDKNIVCGAYDWRLGYNGLKSYYMKLRTLIETTVQNNRGQRAALVALSYGGPVASTFLSQQSPTWKKQYVESFTSLSGAFGGSVWAIASHLTANPNATYGVWNASNARDALTLFGAVMSLYPTAQSMGNHSLVVRTPFRNYTTSASDMLDLVRDAGRPTLAVDMMRALESGGWRRMQDPGVRTVCIYGTNVSTIDSLRVPFAKPNVSTSWDISVSSFVGSGDGTVLHSGLSVCDTWQNTLVVPIFNMTHGGVVFNTQAITTFIKQGIFNMPN